MSLPVYGLPLTPTQSPVFVTPDWRIGRRIADVGGTAIYLHDPDQLPDLSELAGRDCWLIWHREADTARRLAQALAASGAIGEVIQAHEGGAWLRGSDVY